MAIKKSKTVLIISVVTSVIIISVIVYLFYLKPKRQEKKEEESEVVAEEESKKAAVAETKSPGSTKPSAATKMVSLGNDAYLYWKNPQIKAVEVQWVQNGYNALIKKFNLKNALMPSATSPIISDDGVFGEQTHKAVKHINSLSGINSVQTNWTRFKKRLEDLNKKHFPGTTLYDGKVTGTSTTNPVNLNPTSAFTVPFLIQ